jgi:hypothetical protein
MIFIKRIGPDPHANGATTYALQGCPDIWELDNGDFAVIGTDITAAAGNLPPSAGCGPDERMVRIPRITLVSAKADIPDRL